MFEDHIDHHQGTPLPAEVPGSAPDPEDGSSLEKGEDVMVPRERKQPIHGGAAPGALGPTSGTAPGSGTSSSTPQPATIGKRLEDDFPEEAIVSL